MLLGIGLQPYDLILQLLAKSKDPFSGGKTYYSHPSLNDPKFPKRTINHRLLECNQYLQQVAMGLKYKEEVGLSKKDANAPVVICSLGDASCTEGT